MTSSAAWCCMIPETVTAVRNRSVSVGGAAVATPATASELTRAVAMASSFFFPSMRVSLL